MKRPTNIDVGGVTVPAKPDAASPATPASVDTEARVPSVDNPDSRSENETQRESSQIKILDADIKTVLEFMRIKAPELNIQQNQLARIFFYFFVSSALLFLLIFDGIGAEAFNLFESLSLGTLGSINNPRAYVILGATFAIFFFFSRFGYLYYQATKDVELVHNVIGQLLPYEKIKGLYLLDLRDSLMQQCKSNYMVQSLIVFLYPEDNSGKISFDDGPLGGSKRWRVRVIKALMISIVVIVGYVIAVAQIMMLIVFFSFAHIAICLVLFFSFVCY